jgi:hypothetical protein
MALTNLDQRRRSDFARLPLVACGQLPKFWEHGIGFDATAAKKLLDVVNLHYHSNASLVSA